MNNLHLKPIVFLPLSVLHLWSFSFDAKSFLNLIECRSIGYYNEAMVRNVVDGENDVN
jgi:hypothetical protein